MGWELDTLRYTVIVASAALLLVALFPVRRLLKDLPDGLMRRAWVMLGGLLLVMIAAEILYAVGLTVDLPLTKELAIPLTLLVGSWYIMIVSQLSAGSIEDVQRTALLERETVTDALTGLYNRRYLERVLGAEIERARRYDQPMCLAMIDADHFKRVNDEHGHLVGDQALKQLAKLILSLTHINDTVARYGGEEIAVVLPGMDLDEAIELSERLRARMATEPLMVDDGEKTQRITLTVSIGISQLSMLDGHRAERLIERVDRALYAAKNNGRDRVEQVPPPIATGMFVGVLGGRRRG